MASDICGAGVLLAPPSRRSDRLVMETVRAPTAATCSWSATTTCRDAARINLRSRTGQSLDRLRGGHHGGSAINPITGKEEAHGTSIIDVTDPKEAEKYLAHIPGQPLGARCEHARHGRVGGAQMRACAAAAELPRADRSSSTWLRAYGNTLVRP